MSCTVCSSETKSDKYACVGCKTVICDHCVPPALLIAVDNCKKCTEVAQKKEEKKAAAKEKRKESAAKRRNTTEQKKLLDKALELLGTDYETFKSQHLEEKKSGTKRKRS